MTTTKTLIEVDVPNGQTIARVVLDLKGYHTTATFRTVSQPIAAGVVDKSTVSIVANNLFNKYLFVDTMAKAAMDGAPHSTLTLIAQTLGYPPCSECSFVKIHCKCNQSTNEDLSNE